MPRRFATQLSDDYDYAIVWWGQSVARPWGLLTEGVAAMPELDRRGLAGGPLVATYITGPTGTVGSKVSKIFVALPLNNGEWPGANLRIGLASAPSVGYGTVVSNTGGYVLTTPQGLKTSQYTASANSFAFASNNTLTLGGTSPAWPTTELVGIVVTVVDTTPTTYTGTITANTGNVLTIAWVGPAPSNTTVTSAWTLDLKGVLIATTAGLFTPRLFAIGVDRLLEQAVLIPGLGIGIIESATPSTLRLSTLRDYAGSTTDVINTVNTFTIGNCVTVSWFGTAGEPAASASAQNCYLTRDDYESWKTYENIDVLTPYQPEVLNTDSSGPNIPYPTGVVTPTTVPGFTLPANITSYEDLGLFLPFTLFEGISGAGAFGTLSSATATTAITADNTLITNQLVGGFIRCNNSIGRIASNTVDTITLTSAGWTPITPSGTLKFQAWLGHFNSNPHALLEGFRYPSNDMLPAGPAAISFYNPSQGVIHNSVLGSKILGGNGTADKVYNEYSYGLFSKDTHFGQMLPFAYRVAGALGRKISMIHLGINSAGQILRQRQNFFGFPGKIGWWDHNKYLDWTPGNPTGCAARLRKLIETIAVAAQTARANGRKLKILGIVGDQGQADALSSEGRETFKDNLPAFYAWLRKVIQDAGLSLYPTASQIPVVHANIAHSPYEFEGIVPNYELFTFKGDGKKLVNAAIDDLAARDGFAATHLVDDSASLKLSYDPLHLNGLGEVVHGLRKADSFLALLDATLSFCGFDEKVQASAVDLCNIALSHVGDAGQITSINPPDGSPQSLHCARFYPAARDMVLALRPWTFARRRATLIEVTNTRTEWDFAYAVPLDMLMPTAVTANDATDDNIAGASFLAPAPSPQVQPRRQVEPTGYVPQPYVLERDDAGYRVIYTDQASANLRYQARVTDATEFPPLFRLAVSYQLAALLAGPLVKGDVGRTVAEQFMKMLMLTVAQAADTDATQQRTPVKPINPWISNRR